MLDDSHKNLTEAVLQTVAYSDIFDYPLTAQEIHRYLSGITVSFEHIDEFLHNTDFLVPQGPYFALPGREEIVATRLERYAHSRALLPYALRYGQILGALPFIRMVALTGSLAVMNAAGAADFDYMLITVPGRLWMARAFALLLNRIVRLWGHTICPNLIVSQNFLEWKQHNLYIARELSQMIPIAGAEVYQRLMNANAWIKEYLPNAFTEFIDAPQPATKSGSIFQRLLELPLHGRVGDLFERWEMNRKIARFSKQKGFGEETIFNEDICQGNFDHHRKWTEKLFNERLRQLKSSLLTRDIG